jgi:hypothetical protein
VDDVPGWLARRSRAVSAACITIILVAAVLQVVGDDDAVWLPLGVLYFSSAALGLDAVVRGVRKRAGVGPSIANLAPGGWAIFAGMFWIVAVPAYFIGARRRVSFDEEREPVTIGSWIAIAVSALLGVGLACVPMVK